VFEERPVRPVQLFSVAAVLVAFLLVLVPGVQCFAQVVPAPLVIAWAELASNDIESGYSNAAVLVPRQLMAAVSFVRLRYPGKEAISLVRRKAEEAGLEAARKAVATARSQRDLKALTILDPARKAAELLTADTEIAKAEATLVLALAQAADRTAMDQEQETGESTMPLPADLVPWAEHAKGTLLPVVADPAAVCAEKKLDLLVYGTIKPIGTFLAVEFRLYDAVLGRDIWSATEYAFADGLGAVVSSFVRPSAEAIFGRSYARIEFRVDPPVANLYLDGIAYSSSEILYFEPGLHEATAQAAGFGNAGSVFLAEPGFDAVISLTLEEKPSTGLTLSTDPPGATVHIDGAQAGLAPLDLAGAAYPRVARVSLPGYEDVQLVLRPQPLEDQLLVPLSLSDGLTFDNRYDERKGTFYRSLGWFIVSLPVTVLSGGLFQTYRKTGESYYEIGENDPLITEALVSGDYTSQAVFWTSAAATAALAINAIFRLALYIGSAQ